MLPTIEYGKGALTLVMLHLFGSAKSEWTECIALLAPQFHCVAIDLPGFGDASGLLGFSVEEMANSVGETLKCLQLNRFVLTGHSISGKVALAIAAQKPAGLCGLILVAPSPPSPEPIADKDRAKMLAMKRDRGNAESFLDGITVQRISGQRRERAIADFIRCSPDAWTAWLDKGSREDWTDRIGIVDYPTLVVTGSGDPSLSTPVQLATTMKSLTRARIHEIPCCGHLPTMEKPETLSSLISNFVLHDLALS